MDFGTIKSSITRTTVILAVFVGFSVYMTFFSDYNYMRIAEYEREIKDLQVQIAAARDSARIYEQRLQELNSDSETLEKIVREQYFMQRDCEDVYMINDR